MKTSIETDPSLAPHATDLYGSREGPLSDTVADVVADSVVEQVATQMNLKTENCHLTVALFRAGALY